MGRATALSQASHLSGEALRVGVLPFSFIVFDVVVLGQGW